MRVLLIHGIEMSLGVVLDFHFEYWLVLHIKRCKLKLAISTIYLKKCKLFAKGSKHRQYIYKHIYIYIKLNLSERLVDTYQFQVWVTTEEKEMVVRNHGPYLRRASSISLPNHRSPPRDRVPHRRSSRTMPLTRRGSHGRWLDSRGKLYSLTGPRTAYPVFAIVSRSAGLCPEVSRTL